jgi:hypothetical protein
MVFKGAVKVKRAVSAWFCVQVRRADTVDRVARRRTDSTLPAQALLAGPELAWSDPWRVKVADCGLQFVS